MLYLCYLCRFKPLRDHLRGFLIAAWAGDKIAEFSFPEISFHFPLRPWFFFVSPAYAGKSHSYLNSTFLNLGSPPRMRGKARARSSGSPRPRITPAYTGKRARPKTPPLTPRDHPRMCGEKPDKKEFTFGTEGSPPRMRGKGVRACIHLDRNRITPAYAGKRLLQSFCGIRGWDHPRVCGEKVHHPDIQAPARGSPPRMRGKD